ncbi:AMP-binding protein [Paludibacterium yongneupense]|uniref:AMP-binding protein n=1 Tax=Paludibacterium yongneupense TaxID=400061 RepID=UPI00041BD086|nr:AMP-binding protein [Paludibacterium yongneupense]
MTANPIPLLAHRDLDDVVAYRAGAAVTLRHFLADIERVARLLPDSRFMVNTCVDRYRFAVALAAAIVSGRICLLPAALTAENGRQLRRLAPDVICLSDETEDRLGLPRLAYPDGEVAADWQGPIPQIDGAREVAWVFTSGSTGEPQPHRKTWDMLVQGVRGGADLLGLDAARPHAIIGTVPAQHMFGFETTVLMAWQAGAAFSAERPFFPADICRQLDALPRPRLLVITPFHLRALLDAGLPLPAVDLVLSATAPLSQALAREAEAVCRAPLLEIYGSTETGQIAQRRPAQDEQWRLYPGIRLHELDSGTRVSGAHLGQGCILNDRVRLGDDDRFLLLGRNADLINIAGKRNSLAYLDQQLRTIPGVLDGAFFMPQNEVPDGVTRLTAVVAAPGLDAAAVLAALRQRIDPVFLPRPLIFVAALPRNASGKLPLAALWALAATARAEEHAG